MDDIKKEISNKYSIDQKYIDDLYQKAYEEATEDWKKSYYYNKKNGGKCFFCQKEFVKEKKQTVISQYEIYNPVCDCSKNKRKEIENLKKQEMMFVFANIPAEYQKIKTNLDYDNIKKETSDCIKKVNNYIQLEKYKQLGLFLYGDIGCGKTMMATKVLKYLIIKENKKGYFIKMSEIISDIIKADYNFIPRLMEYDVILFDDMDKIKSADKSGWVRERMFNLFDSLTTNNKLIIGTANCKTLQELNNIFDASIISRIIGSCEAVSFTGYDYRLIKRQEKL